MASPRKWSILPELVDINAIVFAASTDPIFASNNTHRADGVGVAYHRYFFLVFFAVLANIE